MKFFLFLFGPLFLTGFAQAAVPYCNIAEIVDGIPTLTANVLEFKKGEKLEILTKDNSAKATAEWNEVLHIYQITLFYGDLTTITLVELPAKSGFLNLQDGKRNFQTQCRFDLN